MKAKTTNILKFMNFIFWIIFIGFCIKTGTIITSFLISILVNFEATKNLYMEELNLFNLYNYDVKQYIFLVYLIISITALKAFLAYLALNISIKFSLDNPFNPEIAQLIQKIAYISIWTGSLAIIADGYSKWLVKTGILVPTEYGSGELLFLAGIIYIIAEVYKKGIEIKSENDLTI